MKEKNLKVLKTLSSRIEAEIIKSFLESNGIESEIFSDDANQSYPSLSNVSGVNVLVKEADYIEACDFLREFEKER